MAAGVLVQSSVEGLFHVRVKQALSLGPSRLASGSSSMSSVSASSSSKAGRAHVAFTPHMRFSVDDEVVGVILMSPPRATAPVLSMATLNGSLRVSAKFTT